VSFVFGHLGVRVRCQLKARRWMRAGERVREGRREETAAADRAFQSTRRRMYALLLKQLFPPRWAGQKKKLKM